MADLRRYAEKFDTLPAAGRFPDGTNADIDSPSEYEDGTCFPLPDVERETNPGLSWLWIGISRRRIAFRE